MAKITCFVINNEKDHFLLLSIDFTMQRCYNSNVPIKHYRYLVLGVT